MQNTRINICDLTTINYKFTSDVTVYAMGSESQQLSTQQQL